ncbi:MAG: hypothetical protein BWZ10_01025 [candidate division BRC1 bacterium ADurb.BinA364]|nr:MAG: hypothetical protein BWZ10_01025 [candidate division BRC1 bacterium ADurb.BinA364]
MADLLEIRPGGLPAAVLVFADPPVIADQMAVVRMENNHGFVGDAAYLQFFQHAAEPGVHQRALARVARRRVLHFRRSQADAFNPVVWRMIADYALVAGIVHFDVVARRVPGLVRIEGVDVEKERLVMGVIHLDPVGRVLHGARHECVALGFPVAFAVAVMQLEHPLRRADFLGLAGVLHRDVVGDGAVAFLAAVPVPGQESPVEHVAVADQVRRVVDQHRDIAGGRHGLR